MRINPEHYDADLIRGLKFTGENPEYFARKRILALRHMCGVLGISPKRILEFGCGTGNNIAFISETFPNSRISGYDICEKSLDIARERFKENGNIHFFSGDIKKSQVVDVVFVNGVFHHIPTDEHPEYLRQISKVLSPAGMLAFFENNSLNPGSRFVMRKIPFDRGAEMINPFAISKLMLNCGFNRAEKRFYFFFPSFVSYLRPLEKYMLYFPFGGQYGIFACKG